MSTTKEYTRQQLIAMVANARGIIINLMRLEELKAPVCDADVFEIEVFLKSTEKDVNVNDLVDGSFDKTWMKI
jgi:hypothetical protein